MLQSADKGKCPVERISRFCSRWESKPRTYRCTTNISVSRSKHNWRNVKFLVLGKPVHGSEGQARHLRFHRIAPGIPLDEDGVNPQRSRNGFPQALSHAG